MNSNFYFSSNIIIFVFLNIFVTKKLLRFFLKKTFFNYFGFRPIENKQTLFSLFLTNKFFYNVEGGMMLL